MKKYSSPKFDIIEVEDVIMQSGITFGLLSDLSNDMQADWDMPDPSNMSN